MIVAAVVVDGCWIEIPSLHFMQTVAPVAVVVIDVVVVIILSVVVSWWPSSSVLLLLLSLLLLVAKQVGIKRYIKRLIRTTTTREAVNQNIYSINSNRNIVAVGRETGLISRINSKIWY